MRTTIATKTIATLILAFISATVLIPGQASAASHQVQWGDTLSGIARENGVADWRDIAEDNNISGTTIYAGSTLTIGEGSVLATSSTNTSQTSSNAVSYGATRGYYDGNTYPAAWANCTWYVDNRVGVPNYLGNASNWRWSLPAHGYTEVSPRAGSIVVIDPWAAGHWAGHVAYVESVNANGSINVSESYWGRYGTFYRTLTPNSGYHFFVL